MIALATRAILPAGRASVDVRLSERWGCQVSTARARRQRSVDEVLDVIASYLAQGDTEAVGRILDRIDAATVRPSLTPAEAIYQADKADADEDVKEAEYRQNPCMRTGRAWFDALGRQNRSTEPVMAALRGELRF